MEITAIKMSLKFSKETPAGWRGLSLGAEATIGTTESLDNAANLLYSQLKSEFAKLWNQNGITNQEPAPEPTVSVETKRVEEPKVEQHTGENKELITDAQMRMIFGKGKAAGLSSKTVRELIIAEYKKPPEQLTKKEAGVVIKGLMDK